MKLTLESTDLVLTFKREGREMPVRVWKGTTERGVPVAAYIATVSPQTHDPAAHLQFEAELTEITGDSRIEQNTFDPRFVL